MPYHKTISWRNCPLRVIPKESRITNKGIGICKGGCNQIKAIWNSTYQLCASCANSWRYYGEKCEMPGCIKVSNGETNDTTMHTLENKLLCNACHHTWRRKCLGWSWERFRDYRQAYLKRPPTFQDTQLSKASPTTKVLARETGKCQVCQDWRRITNTTYQLCSTCVGHEQYRGKTCWCCQEIGGTGVPISFDVNEGMLVCGPCYALKRKYKTSFSILKNQIMTITACQICETKVEHRNGGVQNPKSAAIDHDHDTGKIRGVLCNNCNLMEGQIQRVPCPEEWVQNLLNYLQNPPLTKPGIQN